MAEQIGADGQALLAALYGVETPTWLREVPAVQTLRQVWVQQYSLEEQCLRWRTPDPAGVPPSQLFLTSPDEPEAHCGHKRHTQWVGYKVHVSETCDNEAPPLITHVETAAAPTADTETLPAIHQALQGTALLPQAPLVDTGDIDADLLVTTPKA